MVKSALDGVTAIAIASSSGIGVMVAVIPMLFVQGGLTLLAREAGPLFNKNMLAQISGIGGVLLIALAIQDPKPGGILRRQSIARLICSGVVYLGL